MMAVCPAPDPSPTLLPSNLPAFQLFAWPRWTNPADLNLLLGQYGRTLGHREDACLILYADPGVDGTEDECAGRLEAARSAVPVLQTLRIVLIHQRLLPTDIAQLHKAITVSVVLPSIMMRGRAKLLERIDAPFLLSTTDLRDTLKVWDALKRGERLPWRRPPCPLPPEASLQLDQWRKHLPTHPGTAKRLAIVVPYRDRADHLAYLGPYLRDYLGPQPFDLFVLEQANNKPFNRAKLFNVGFEQLSQHYDYFAFHDVDLFPVDADYSYVTQPTHLAARVGPAYHLFYKTCMGGVLLLNREDYLALNGFSNDFWGWGAEDDAFYLRMKQGGRPPTRRNGLFDSLPHASNAFAHADYQDNLNQLKRVKQEAADPTADGLSTLDYRLVSVSRSEHYFRLKVDL